MSVWDEATQLSSELAQAPPDPYRASWTALDRNGDVYYHVPANGYLTLIAYLAGARNLAWTPGPGR